ncbi:MAG: hypothetical protein JWN64_77 [Parcubacteria group bacterium]|nr:hypothetical protein [Parcubacteria group bacterium]
MENPFDKISNAFKSEEKPKAPEGAIEGMDAENVVPMAEQNIIVRDSLGNVVGTAKTPEEERAMQRQAAIDQREAA